MLDETERSDRGVSDAASDGQAEPSAFEPGAAIDQAAPADAESSSGVDVDDGFGDVDEAKDPTPIRHRISPLRTAMAVSLLSVLLVGGVIGWLGFRDYELQKVERDRDLYLQVARQGALNLTTIDFKSVDTDVQRIMESATGTFYDDFQKRAQPFIEVVKQAQSKSVGSIAEAGVELASDNQAQVLVAVTVKTSTAGTSENAARSWRMRMVVQKQGDQAKVSNVEFVP